MIHIDSWEMGSQNWTNDFREQFRKRRGYDPLLFFQFIMDKLLIAWNERKDFFGTSARHQMS